VGFIQSSFFMGQMLGGFVFPILANLYGRKRIMLLGSGIGAVCIMLCGFAQNLE
jgi:MFS family permease